MNTAQGDGLARRILDVAPLLGRSLERHLREHDQRMDATHVQILSMLVERPHSISELAARQHVSLPSMSKTIQTLVDRGWTERTPDAHDQRVVRVRLTVSGGDALREARAAMLSGVEAALSALSDRERALVAEALAVLERALAAAAPPSAGPGGPA